MTFGRFITDYVSPPDFAWDGVDRAWIDEAPRSSSGGA
jgi:hypothetical protein